eukprot:TRINITY_DN94098_c0_g1_i1.p2 TRINITY_DN94098_c0_g1~~TRINITY_DN94098_c0_g1_i1.p2  ORF type:complete len:141 (-),score=25.06 TRINITY_DN94098_c0_g1_i1:167-589(-)
MSSGGARAACQPLFWDALVDLRSTLGSSLDKVRQFTAEAWAPQAPCSARFHDDATTVSTETDLRQHQEPHAHDAADDRHDCDNGVCSTSLACQKLKNNATRSWEWPLSRTEKKDRIHLLMEMDLLTQIEELRERAEGVPF